MNPLRNTFPLNELAIARQVLRQIITDPISWIPLVPPVALYSFFDPPGWIPLMVGGGVMAGLGIFWKGQWNDLVAQRKHIAILEHNRKQDQFLQDTADQFGKNGHGDHAKWLNRFLRLKQKIEQQIHEDGTLNSQKIQMECLVDALCFEARDQLLLLVESQSKDFTAISSAYDTLESASAQIDNLLGPNDRADGEPTHLQEISNRLREEMEIAHRVQERLKNPSAEPSFIPPENPQSQ